MTSWPGAGKENVAQAAAASKRKLAVGEPGSESKPTPERTGRPAQAKRAKQESAADEHAGNGCASGHGDDSTALNAAANGTESKPSSGRRQVNSYNFQD